MKNMRIGQRLGLAFGAMVLLMFVMAIASLVALRQIDGNLNDVIDDRYVKVRRVTGIFEELNLQARNARNALLLPDAAQRATELQSLRNSTERATEHYEALIPTVKDPQAKLALDEALTSRSAYKGHLDVYVQHIEAARMDEARTTLLERLRPVQLAYFASLRKLIERQETLMHLAGRAADESVDRAVWQLSIAVLIGTIAGIAFGVLATRSVTQPLQSVRAEMDAIAAGDLTREVTINRGDELGQLQATLRTMLTGLKELVRDVRSGVDSVTTASSQIAAGNLDLSSRTEEQASSLQETASAMEEITGTVSQAADSAALATKLASRAASTAREGGEIVSRVVSTMEAITTHSHRIEQIIGVIDGIAFQTNILALNAAVEAARAGDQGRGFAVVASEVRSLAQRSAGAAREIKDLIAASGASVETGRREVAGSGETMRQIVDEIAKVSDLVTEIAHAAQEQRRGIEQINQAVAQMDRVTQQNAALVEESAAAAGSLEAQAQKLSISVSSFRVA